MIGSGEFVNSEAAFGFDDYRGCLAARHANLERAIQEEWARPVPDQLRLTRLKRERLHVKDALVGLHVARLGGRRQAR